MDIDFLLKEKVIYKYNIKCQLIWIEPKKSIYWTVLKSIGFYRIFCLILEEKKDRFKCYLCKENFTKGFSIVNDKKFQKMNITKWIWFCENCLNKIEYQILVSKLYNMNDLYFEIFTSFITLMLLRGGLLL